ncbi:DUF2501 domain-containing protein [Variovorax sp. J22R133]|uniref:DUF2501 domain-containing protein n=1 Tax=Variovorax brevis TaxID=3053503 RepID=UPI0025756F3A|nr:DUF2501 domain-containing protein [Variovorax sp. J22R133]MDM0114673.1 DUF2501 domain-containing protein [Variovorax sp. J22R133]
MTTSSRHFARAGIVFSLLAGLSAVAGAQSLDSLKGMAGGLTGGGGGAGMGSLSSGSMGNAAGVLEFCMKNNFLGGGDASSIKDGLMSKIPGGQPAKDPGYTDGAKGLLTSSDGSKMDLSSGMTGLKKEATKQACDMVLKQAKSML